MTTAWWLWGALALSGAALVGPVPALAHRLFWVHMIQHLLLTLAVAPMLLLGEPLTKLLKTTRGATRQRIAGFLRSRPVALITHPLFTWVVFAAVMWIAHFSPLYQEAIENDLVHALEHVFFLGAALLFWTPIIGSDPISRRRLSWPARLGYLVAALPFQSFLGLALYSSDRPLYDAYPDLSDQRLGATIMWVGGDLAFVAALALGVGAWMRADRRETARTEAWRPPTSGGR